MLNYVHLLNSHGVLMSAIHPGILFSGGIYCVKDAEVGKKPVNN